MKVKPQLTELVQPFNITDPDEREAMFMAKPSETVTMIIYLVIYAQPCASANHRAGVQ